MSFMSVSSRISVTLNWSSSWPD